MNGSIILHIRLSIIWRYIKSSLVKNLKLHCRLCRLISTGCNDGVEDGVNVEKKLINM